MIIILENRLKKRLIGVLAGILTLFTLPCYADGKPIKEHLNQPAKGFTLSEDVLDSFKFSFVQAGHDREAQDLDLYLQVADSNTGQFIDKYSLLHKHYGNSVYQRPAVHALAGKDGNIEVLLFFRYGGDGDHLENRLHWFEFSNGSLNKFGEQNISDPEIIMDSGKIDHVKGIAVFSICNVCDGWEVSAPEDIFFIPISVSVQNHKLQVTNLLGKNEKLELMGRFDKQKELKIQEQSKYSGGERYKIYTESVSEQLDEILK